LLCQTRFSLIKWFVEVTNMPRKRTQEIEEASSADAFINEKHIGQRIRRLRLKKSMGLVELGKHTGLSASFLSQLETGRVIPTLRNLARIAMVFSKDLSYFFDSEPRSLFKVNRLAERLRMPENGTTDPSYVFESLGYQVPDRAVDPYIAEFQPGRKPQDVRPHMHPGYEFVYVIEGALEICHGDNAEQLDTGDAVYFDSSTTHTYRCMSNTRCRAVIITVGPQMPTQQPRHFGNSQTAPRPITDGSGNSRPAITAKPNAIKPSGNGLSPERSTTLPRSISG
jgi:transcriptional regulator with XRE-family HTH domain